MSGDSKVVVIGLDSTDRGLMQEWAAAGHLPTFKRVLDDALVGSLSNQPFFQGGSVWPNFYFGADASVHGQYDGIRHFDPATYKHSPYRLADQRRAPIWSLLSDAGKRSVVIDTPYIPLPKDHNGIMVLDWLGHAPHSGGDRLRLVTHPESFRETIEQKYGLDPFEGKMCDRLHPRTAEEIAWFRDNLLKRIRMKTDFTRDMIAEGNWDLLVSVFSESHCVGHHCWHLHDPSHEEHDSAIAAALGDPLRDVYVALDGALKELLEACDEQTTVLVFLSHGMEMGYTGTRLLDRILARLNGEHKPMQDGFKRTLRDVWRSTPAPLRQVLRPVRTKARNAMYNDGFLPDRQQRLCFEVFGNERAAGIRVNLAGREENGLVQPGQEFEELCERLTRELLEIRNEETGEPLVAEVGRTKTFYEGEVVEALPDLMVRWNRTQPIKVVSSPKVGRIRHPHKTIRTGDHRPGGMLLALGKDVKGGRLNSKIYDIDLAPTIATLFGLDTAQFQGQPVDALCPRSEEAVNG